MTARSNKGFSLVEVLVATAITAVALAGAWPWLWNAAAASREAGSRAQVTTAEAFALRVIGDDLAQAVSLMLPPAGRSPRTTLVLSHRHPGEAPETITVVWDPVRHVLWRKTSSTYLADQVVLFDVRYFAATGEELTDADISTPGWLSRVARLTLSLRVGPSLRESAAVLQAVLRPA
jgi:prepilin-type N-terminal cleavage/methylation domain-containing protein